jgi:hypothetical protein
MIPWVAMDLRQFVTLSTLESFRSSVLMGVIHWLLLVTLPVMVHKGLGAVQGCPRCIQMVFLFGVRPQSKWHKGG